MENKISVRKIIFIILIMSNLVSCQEKKSNSIYKKGFVIQDTILYYNLKQIAFGDPVSRFVEALGKYDREVIETAGGETNQDWMWKEKLIRVNKHSDDDYYTLTTLIYDKEKNEFNIDSNHKDFLKEYKSLEEIIKKYGKFDTYKEEKEPVRISKMLVWDNLGVIAGVNPETNVVEGITLQIMHSSKTRDSYASDKPIDTEISKSDPKQEYTGNFTYNGNTINFKELGYDSWDKVVSGLKIAGEEFDPPGDSKAWSREIRESYDHMMVYLYRFSNQLNETKPKLKLDGVNYITIGSFTNNDKK
jgi:hypothetical protein